MPTRAQLRSLDPGWAPALLAFVCAYAGLAEGTALISRSIGPNLLNGAEGILLVAGGFALMGLLQAPHPFADDLSRLRTTRVGSGVVVAVFALPFAPAIGTVSGTLGAWSFLLFALLLLVLGSVLLVLGSVLVAGLAISRFATGSLLVAVGLLVFFHRDWWLSEAMHYLAR